MIGSTGSIAVWTVVILLVAGLVGLIIFEVAAGWKIYVKAGQSGWSSLIPIYSVMILCRMVKRPEWWVLLLFVPFVSLVVVVLLYIDLARSFGKDIGFAILMIFFPFVMFPILGYGSAQYRPNFQNLGSSGVQPSNPQNQSQSIDFDI